MARPAVDLGCGDASKPPPNGGGFSFPGLSLRSGGELVGCSGLVLGEGEAVVHEGPADEVDVLAGPAVGVGSSEVEGVFEAAVDGFGVCSESEDALEVGVAGWDGAEVLGPVQFPGGVLGVAVESDGQGPCSDRAPRRFRE